MRSSNGAPRSPAAIHTEPIDRGAELRAFLLIRLLRRHRRDFTRDGRVAAFVGDYIADRIRIYGRYERAELDTLVALVFPHLPAGADCLDVGANIGNHSLVFSRHFAHVIAFEPNPVARSLLDLNLRLNGARNVEVRPIDLSDLPGSARLTFVADNLGGARLPAATGDDPDFSRGLVDEAVVDLAAGDEVLDPDRPVGFIKIDVEGMEPQAIRGLAGTIRRHRPAIMLEQIARDSAPVAPGLLTDLGYVPCEIRRIPRARSRLLDNLLTLVKGERRHALTPIHRFEPRDYPVVVYLPENLATRMGLSASPARSD
jgi:FkbM family methyltransferase